MRLRLFMLSAMAIGFADASYGQADSRLVVIPSAVIAFQPADNTYTSPYLEEYLGGFGWGGSLAVLGEHRNVVFGGEINTARHSKTLTGRNVGSETSVSFQESFASALLGYSGDRRTFHALGGAGITLGAPQYGDRERDPRATKHWFVLTGGVNWLVPSSSQIQFAIGARYYYVFDDGGEFSRIGLGNSAFRTSIGVSFGSGK